MGSSKKKKKKEGTDFFHNVDSVISQIGVVGHIWRFFRFILTKSYDFITLAWQGFKDALALRPIALIILACLSFYLAFSTVSTLSFYSNCNKTEYKTKTIEGDFSKLNNLQDFENAKELAQANNDLDGVKSIQKKINKLRFRTKFGRYGAKTGLFYCNNLFGFASTLLFLACFTILFFFHQRVYFPAIYSWTYVMSRTLFYGIFVLGSLTLWGAIFAHLMQDYFLQKPPLLWGGAYGKFLYDSIYSSFGAWGVGGFLFLLPTIIGLVVMSLQVSPEEKAKKKAKIEAERQYQKQQKEKAEKLKAQEIEKTAKQIEEEHLKALQEEEERKQKEAQGLSAQAGQTKSVTNKKETEQTEQGKRVLRKVGKAFRGLFSIGSGTMEGEAQEEAKLTETKSEATPKEPIVREEPKETQNEEASTAQEIKPQPMPSAPDKPNSTGIEVVDKTEESDALDPSEIEEDVMTSDYVVPHIELLEDHGKHNEKLDREVIDRNAQKIIDELAKFNIEVSVPNATVGPTITLYELRLGDGIRISKVSNLDDDIAMALRVEKVRIIAPLPGRGTVGVEVPNPKVQTVSMRSMITSSRFNEAKNKMQLPIAIGKTITNETFVFDLAKAPHLLIAGATGQGKSVGLNALIASLLYSRTPDELKLVMVDPKMVEFSVYEGIAEHFLIKPKDEDKAIITDMTKVMPMLKSLCEEMDNRYRRLSEVGVRNIIEYNGQIEDGKIQEEDGHCFLPYIVVIIDEFADLMMTAKSTKKEVEILISRLAQKARAVGIHLVMATQRPSTDVITGLIKANFPARIAFRTSSPIDSRTILDSMGAEQLIGRGDMLYYSGLVPERVQCAFIDTPEIEDIVEHILEQPKPFTKFELPECPDEEGDDFDAASALTKIDPMLKEVARMVVETGVGSTSNIQRRFEVGYNKAGRIMDQMQALGIVGPQVGSKPREVLIYDLIELDELFISKGI